ncbi:MAG: MBL fold metallo-hydrolase [Candidatus Aquicultorales bacterium]
MATYHRLILGTNTAFLIQGRKGYILVDGGNPYSEPIFFWYLKKFGIDPGEIKLAIATHGHFDHVGALHAVQKECGCPVVCHESESHLLEEGEVVIPPGTNWLGRAGSKIGWRLTKLFQFEAVKPDITVDSAVSLEEFGVDGRIIPTPGHTDGSLSVLLDDGEAFVGDLAVDVKPFVGFFPPFGNDPDTLLNSWKKLIHAGATHINPGHFRRFTAEKLDREHARIGSPAMGTQS